MEKFDKKQRWTTMIDNNNKLHDTAICNKNTDVCENSFANELFDDNELANVSFSLDNEKILGKINEIINDKDNINSQLSLLILKNQHLIATYLSKYVIQNSSLEYEFFIKLLNWLMFASNILAKRLNMKPYSHDLSKIPFTFHIPRCSYKFCSFKDTCSYNYDNKMGGCYADHYVHNMVHADMEALANFIQFNSIDQRVNHTKEIIKCVSTISYVIKNMYDELKNVSINNYHLFCKDYKSLHKNRKINGKYNPPKKNNKKKYNKKNTIKK